MEGQGPGFAQSPDLAALLGVTSSQAMDATVASTSVHAHADSMLNNLQGLTSFGFPCSFDFEHAPDLKGQALALELHAAVIKSYIPLAYTRVQGRTVTEYFQIG